MPADVFDLFNEAYEREKQEEMSLQDYLLGCRDDPSMYASAAERMISAIGEPKLMDTNLDERFGRIFLNRTIKIYPETGERCRCLPRRLTTHCLMTQVLVGAIRPTPCLPGKNSPGRMQLTCRIPSVTSASSN